MNTNSFNKDRYFELLLQDKHSKTEYMELLSYQVVLENQIIYDNPYRYISLVEKLLEEVMNQSPDLDEFYNLDEFNDPYLVSASEEISTLIEKNLEDFDILEQKIRKEGITILDNFQINCENSKKFRFELNIINRFFDDANSEEEYVILVDTFPLLLKESLPYLRYYANPDSGLLKDNQILREIMILFTIITGVAYTFLNSTLFNLIWK